MTYICINKIYPSSNSAPVYMACLLVTYFRAVMFLLIRELINEQVSAKEKMNDKSLCWI